MNAQASNFITLYAKALNDMLDARLRLKNLRERNAATGIVESMTADDFAGENAHLTKQDLVDAFAAMDSLETLLTDFTKTPPAPTAALGTLLRFRP